MALIDYTPFSSRRWFDDLDNHIQRMQQTFLKRSFSDCGMEMPLQLISGDTSSSWKLLDDITPFKPEDIQVTIAQDGKSISLDAKSERTAADGGKISRAISKRWAWSGAVDANNLKCFIKDGALMIEAPQKEAVSSPTVKPIPVQIENTTSKIPVRVESSTTANQTSTASVKTSTTSTHSSAATSVNQNQNGTITVSVQPVEESVKPVHIAPQTGLKESTVNKSDSVSSEATFSKVHTGSVANARRLFEDIAEKEKSVSINRINASISEHKLRSAQDTTRVAQAPQPTVQTSQPSVQTPPATHPITQVLQPVTQPTVQASEARINVDTSRTQMAERIIPTTIQSDNTLQTIDKSGQLSLFDDSLFSFERQFWENRVKALNRFHETSKKFHEEFSQSLHWPNIFEDSRILRSNFSEVSKGLSVKENEITANEFKVALDVAGCPVENLSVRVSDDYRLIVEAQWRDGFTDRLARREWKLPQRISDEDVKCTISSDGILVIRVHLKQQLMSGDKKIPIMQQ